MTRHFSTYFTYNFEGITFQHCGLGHDKTDPCLPVPGGLTQHLPHGNTHLLKKLLIVEVTHVACYSSRAI